MRILLISEKVYTTLAKTTTFLWKLFYKINIISTSLLPSAREHICFHRWYLKSLKSSICVCRLSCLTWCGHEFDTFDLAPIVKCVNSNNVPPPHSYPTHDSLCPSSLVNHYTFYFHIGDWRQGSRSRLHPQLFLDFFLTDIEFEKYIMGLEPGNVWNVFGNLGKDHARPKVIYRVTKGFSIKSLVKRLENIKT